MVYGNSEVVPVYYCTFTVFSITGGALIYNELGGISAAQAVMFGMGVLCAFTGVAVLMVGEREVGRHAGRRQAADGRTTRGGRCRGRCGGRARLAEPDHAPAPQAVPVHGQFHPEVGEQPVFPSALKGKLPEIGDTHVPGPRQHRKAQHARAAAPSSSSLLCGGIGASLQQASTETVLASDRERALLQVQAASYPGSLQSARRQTARGASARRPSMAALGERAVSAFSAMAIMESSSLRRTRERRRARISTGRPSR